MKYINDFKYHQINEQFKLLSFEQDRDKYHQLKRELEDKYHLKFYKMVHMVLKKIRKHLIESGEEGNIIEFLSNNQVFGDNLYFDDYIVEYIIFDDDDDLDSDVHHIEGVDDTGIEKHEYLSELSAIDLYEWLQTLTSNKRVLVILNKDAFMKMNENFKLRSFEIDLEKISKLKKDIENIKQEMNDKYRDKFLKIFTNLLKIITNLEDYQDDIVDFIDEYGYELYYKEGNVLFIDLERKEVEIRGMLDGDLYLKFKNIDVEYLYDWINIIIKIKPVYTVFNIDTFKKINSPLN
jgi:hypothetical protein